MIKNKIKLSESVAIILSVFFAHSIMSMPRTILTTTKSGTIINLIYISILACLLVFVLCKFMKHFQSKDILDISEYLGGRTLKNTIGFIFIAYFLTTLSILLRNFSECLKIVYFPMTNLFFIILLFIIVLGITAKSNINVLGKICLLLVPFIILSVICIFTSNVSNFNTSNTFPLLGDGFKQTFIIGLSNLGAFGGISFLYFIPPFLNDGKDFRKIAITSISIAVVYLIICVCAILFMFDFLLEANQLMPLYSAARQIEFGSFFQRLESAFLLIWILQMAMYFTLSLMFCINIFKKITNISTTTPLVFPFCLLVFAISLFPENYASSHFFENDIYGLLVIALTFVLSPLLIFLSYLKRKKSLTSPRERQSRNLEG